MFSTIYNFGQHVSPPPPTTGQAPPDDMAHDPLCDTKSMGSAHTARSNPCTQGLILSSSLSHVQGASSGCLTGTVPTFTFMPHSHYEMQLSEDLKHHQPASEPSACMQQQQQQQQQADFVSHDIHRHYELQQIGHDVLEGLGFGGGGQHDPHHHHPQSIYHAPVDLNDIMNSDTRLLPPLPMEQAQQAAAAAASINIPTTTEREAKRQRTVIKPRTRLAATTQRAPWTSEEDNLLRLAVQLYGDKTEKWSKIAACVPGRTNKNCRKRWFHSLDPSLRKGAWTEEEDKLLREGVMKYPNQWSKIADMLDGRTDDQCAKRWRESLDPSIDRSEWTPDEDRRLIGKYEQYGSQWQKIAQHFEGRPGLHCRNRWRKLQRLVQLSNDKHNSTTTAAATATDAFIHTVVPADDHYHYHHQHHALRRTSSLSPLPPSCAAVPGLHAHEPPSSETSSLSSMSSSSLQLTTPPQHPQQRPPPPDSSSSSSSHSTATQKDREPFSDLNPYGCDIPGCYASFSQSSSLFYHMKGAHPNFEAFDKPYRCAIPSCTKRYKNINGLQYHLRDAKGSSAHTSQQSLSSATSTTSTTTTPIATHPVQ